MPYTVSLTVYTQRNFAADFLQAKCILHEKARLRFESFFGGGGLRGNVRCSS